MSESGFWKYLNKGMKPYWYAIRVENNISSGTPDLWYSLPLNEISRGTSGWIELKYLKKFPKVLNLYHFTKSQQNTMIAIDKNAKSFLFIQIEKDYYLIPGSKSKRINGLTEPQLTKISAQTWYKSINFYELNLILRRE